MNSKEAFQCLREGKIVKSKQCLYIEIDGAIYWKWIGESTWTYGGDTLEECLNESEKSEVWEVVFDTALTSY